VPEVRLHPRFRPFVAETLPGLLAGAVGLVADPGARDALARVAPRGLFGPVVVAVGPEGGWADHEVEALVAAGMREDRPPEDWLYKVWDGDNLVDLIFHPAGGAVGDEHFERATAIEVNALRLLVASIDDVLVTKLLAITEQEPDYRAILEVARSVREQVDWNDVEARTKTSPFARAFFTLGEGLGIVERRTILRPAHASS